MAQLIPIPGCALKLLSHIYPELHFDRVECYVGIPTLLNTGQPAITQPYFGRQRIFFRDEPDFCDLESFLVLAHELVHVQQIQNMPSGGYVPGVYIFNYVYCYIVAGFSDTGHNCYEEEAYNFANGPFPGGNTIGRLRSVLTNSPCACDGQLPLAADAQNLQALINAVEQQGAVFRHTSCSTNDCFADLAARIGVIPALIVSAFAFVAAVLAFVFGFAGVNTGSLAGLVVGAALGAIFGFLGGLLGTILGGFLGAVLGSLLGALLQSLFDALTGGDSGGQLNLETSADDGQSFGSKTTFERSREQMSLQPAGDRLFVGWTGLDAQVNVLAVGQSLPGRHFAKRSFEQSNHCGPALAWHQPTQQLMTVWVGTEGHLNIIPVSLVIPGGSDAQLILGTKQTLSAKSPADATPGLVSVNSFLYLAWVEDPTGVVRLWRSGDNGATWNEPTPTAGRTLKTGSAALAFGDGRLYLAWLTTDAIPTILVESFLQDSGDGSLSSSRSGVVIVDGLNAVPAVKGGPAVAYGDGRLYVVWTDPTQHMHLVSSTDQGTTFGFHKRFDPETSRGNAGPAIAFEPGAPTSVLMFGWTGQG